MTDDELLEVHLVGLPLDVQRQSNEHYDALVREFDLIRRSDDAAGSVPDRLLSLIDELSTRFQQFGEQPRSTMEAERARGAHTVDVMFEIPPELVGWCQPLLDLLDEADAYCRAGEHLVTEEAPPQVRAYREWFLREFIDQAKGDAPRPWSALAYHGSVRDGDSATVSLSGEIDIAAAPRLRDDLNRLHSEGIRNFVIDVERVSFIDSVGLSVVLALYRRCREEGGTVSVIHPTDRIRRTLEISGLLDVLNVH
jgi:anti-anti-sigma factor